MANKKTTQTEPKGYAEAMAEVESILAEMDSTSVDVDVLSARVERASFLINWCSERIASARMTVENLVADLVEEDFDEDGDEEDPDDDD